MQRIFKRFTRVLLAFVVLWGASEFVDNNRCRGAAAHAPPHDQSRKTLVVDAQ